MIAHVDSPSYLVTVMGLMVPWSLTLAVVDGYSVFVRHLPPQTRVTSIIVTGDWVREISSRKQNITSLFFVVSPSDIKMKGKTFNTLCMLCHRFYHFCLWVLLARQPVSPISCSKPGFRIAQQSFAIDIGFLQ